MKIIGFLVAIALTYFVASILIDGCTVTPIDSDTDHDTGIILDAGGDCEAACSNLEELGCEAGKGSPGIDEIYGTEDDIPCIEVCINTEADGVPMHAGCMSTASSCSEADECFE